MSTELATISRASDPTEVRRQRGLAIAALTRIEQKKSGLWSVPSQKGTGHYYVRLDTEPPTCTCPDFEERSQPCKHVFAVQFTVERESRPDGTEVVRETVTVTETMTRETKAKKPTYKQVWPAYNLAQTREKTQFQVLLRDLCGIIEEPTRKPGPGRKPVPMADLTFAIAYKVYTLFSGRRFQTDLDGAVEKGFLSRPVRYNTVFDSFENPAFTPILRGLIAESSRPLKSVELDFAIDSSGFATSRFVRWFDHKYGVVKQKYDWVRAPTS